MEKLTCIIVDDEPLAIRLLENYVARTSFLELCGSFQNPIEALDKLQDNPVNLVFLDIQMPDLNGMELSMMVPPEIRIIFTTAFKQYAYDSYEVNALDFLLKPIRYNKFLAAVEKAKEWFLLKNTSQNNLKTSVVERKNFFIKVDGELIQIDINKILYINGMKDYVMFYMEGEKRPLITHLTMKALEDMLPSSLFMRVNRSYIVSLNKIRSIDRNNNIYIGTEIIHVTDAYLNSFEIYLNQNSIKK